MIRLRFKYIGDTEDEHLIAGEGYARALRKGVITGGIPAIFSRFL